VEVGVPSLRRWRKQRRWLLLVVVRQHRVDGLHDGEHEEEDGRDEGDDGPGVARVVLDEAGAPLVPALLPVGVDLAVHGAERASLVQHGLVREPVEHLGHGLVVAEPVPDYAPGREQLRVGGRLDDVVHEEDVGGDLVGVGVGVQALEGHEAKELVLGGLVHGELRDAEHAAVEVDVVQAAREAPREPDPRLLQLRRRRNELVPPPLAHLARRAVQQAAVAHVDGVERQVAAEQLRGVSGQRHELEHHLVDGVVRLCVCFVDRQDTDVSIQSIICAKQVMN
jgi:hypothetical protein